MKAESSKNNMADETEIFIESSLREKLIRYAKSRENTSDVVFLYGNVYDTSIHISDCISSTILKISVSGQSFELDCLPKGIQFLGICHFTSKFKEEDLKSAKTLLKDLLLEKPNDRIHENLLLWQHCLETSNDYGMMYDTSTSKLAECQLQFDSYLERFSQNLLTFRIQTTFDICVESNFKALNHKINKLAKELQSECTTYLIKDFNMFLSCESTKDQVEQSCADLFGLMDDSQCLEASLLENRKTKSRKNTSKNSNKTSVIKDAIDVKLLTKVSMSPAAYKDNTMTPIICYGEESGTDISLSLPVDVVVMATKTTLITDLPRLFTSAVSQQLKQIQNVMQGFSNEENWCIPRPYHYKLPGFSHYVTILYPEIDSHGQGIDEKLLELYRTEIHKQLLLPLNRPLLRICNRYTFGKDRKPEVYLINPHVGISSSGLSGGTLGVVDGHYSYHHYMQDNFNDDKWGCAYRSLQTIFSWFRHQGYTTKPVPSHRQIQQALVDVGDKKSNFVGSRQWIGSFEVNLCLEHLLGITSKIMFVSSGAEMSSKGRELLYHFQTQGTPIMIGGGVLAHTIIGVDYNQQTGEIKFLILDPHYTGSEDLKIVLDKGWCGWKGPAFWDQQAHYNMCMPQRPDVI